MTAREFGEGEEWTGAATKKRFDKTNSYYLFYYHYHYYYVRYRTGIPTLSGGKKEEGMIRDVRRYSHFEKDKNFHLEEYYGKCRNLFLINRDFLITFPVFFF